MSKSIEIPVEVENYFKNGQRTILDVKGNDDFTLTILFDNGEVRRYNMNKSIHKKVFAPFRDINRFKQVYIDNKGCVAWDIDPNVDSEKIWSNRVDLCPDACYIYSEAYTPS